MADLYTKTTYSDGSSDTSYTGSTYGGEAASFAGVAIGAGVIAAVGGLYLGHKLAEEAESSYYQLVGEAAYHYESNATPDNQRQLIDSLKYLTGAKVKIFGMGTGALVAKTFITCLFAFVIPIVGWIYIIYNIVKWRKRLKIRRADALNIANQYGLGDTIRHYMYSMGLRMFWIYVAAISTLALLAWLAS